jgi:DNA-binding winged helix-turn-helix (wHTH) protein
MSSLINHYRFGEFTLDADQRILLREGKPLALAPKVFDTLLILVENSGRIVTKEELMSRLWPDTFVEEGNLPYNIKQLRKSLGEDELFDFGYSFNASCWQSHAADGSTTVLISGLNRHWNVTEYE